MKLALLVLLAAIFSLACGQIRPWVLEPAPPDASGRPQWLAAWRGVRDIAHVCADNSSTLLNRITVRRLAGVGGAERTTTGLAVWLHDGGDLLVYASSYYEDGVWRYQIDPATWQVRGQLLMPAPIRPRGLALASDGDSVCVSGSEDESTRIVQCYRISRALDDDGIIVNEWWIMVSSFSWHAENTTAPQSDALLFDAKSLPSEASSYGSLWIDAKTAALVRFPVDSQAGAYLPSYTQLPVLLQTARLAWTARTGEQLIVAPDSAYTVTWSTTSGAPSVQAAEPLYRTQHAADHLRAVVWRAAVLDNFDRLALASATDAVVEIAFNHTDAALASGEIALPSRSPSRTTTPSASAQPTPRPSEQEAPAPPIDDDSALFLPPKKAASKDGSSLSALWALLVVTPVVPCACILAIVLSVVLWHSWKIRREPAKIDIEMQPFGAEAPSHYAGQWSDAYDTRRPAAVAMPMMASARMFPDA